MKLILPIILLFCSQLALATEFTVKPTLQLGLGFSATLIENNPCHQSSVYGVIQSFTLNFGGEDGGLRFLGIGATINNRTDFVVIPMAGCIMDKYCFSTHINKEYIGMGFTYSFGKP